MDLVKEISLFVFNLSMLICALYVAIQGGRSLGIHVFALIPFLYLFYFFTKDIPDKNKKIEELENEVKYYKKNLEQYEIPNKEA